MTASFDEYVRARTRRSAWVREPGLSLYVRRGTVLPPHVDFAIANMDADQPGGGALTRFLDAWEPRYTFRFENVINHRLPAYLARRGYVPAGPASDAALMMAKPVR